MNNKDLVLKRYVLKCLKLDNYKQNYMLTKKLPVYLNYALIGLLLSDGGLEKPTLNGNVRLSVNMSLVNLPYLFHLYNLFEPYINNDINFIDIKLNKDNKSFKNYSTVRFKTICMPQLLYYYNIFYKYNNINNSVKKVVPLELKSNFNGVSLAHLIMGDGNFSFDKSIIRIYTNSFTKDDVLFLSNVIYTNLNINNRVIYDRKDQYIIVIEKNNVKITQDLILSYMHPSMYYKLGIKDDLISDFKFNYEEVINLI